ncbi:MAG: DUF2070 family protein, partial [Candidatus Thorarchaeota archaeon]|nr:DUF2070 family protein [Candidatus Thorarchaeota archaeon]
MGEKAKVKETIGLYSKLWQLPTFRGIVIRIVLAVALGALLSTAVRLLSGPVLNPPAYLCYYLMLLVVPVFVGYALMYALVRKPGSPLDARRTTGIVQMGVYIWILIGLVGTVIAAITVNPYTEVRLWSAGMVAAFLLFTFLATGLSDHHPLRNTAATLMPPLLWYVTVLTLVHSVPSFLSLSPFWWVSAVLSFALCSIGVNHIFRAVSRPFERDLGISGPELLRSFGYDYLVGDPCPFEQLMSKIATVQDVPIEVVVIKRGPTLAAVGVVLYVHPGPFRDLGSSALPSAVIRDIQNTFGVPAFVMHGTCTHHQNLTTSQDFDVVMAEIHRLIGEVKCYERVSGPHWTE